MAHDYRIMYSKRGWIRLPAIELGLVLPKPLLELLRWKMTPITFRDALFFGRKFDAEEALQYKLVDSLEIDEKQLVHHAIQFASKVSPRERTTFAITKSIVFEGLVALLEAPSVDATFHLKYSKL